MTERRRNIVIGVCVLASLGSLAAYGATGMYAFTRFWSEETSDMQANTGLESMFAETGLDGGRGEIEKIDNVTALGLLPSGPGLASLSVATVSGPALAVAGFAWWRAGRKSSGRTSAQK